MTWVIRNALVGSQPIANRSTVQNHPLGSIVNADDPTYGSGEFMYVKGVASGLRGSWVTINADDYSTILLVANAIGPVGILMAALVADEYGWAQISGKAVGLCLASYADNGLVWGTATAGSVDDAVADGDMVHLAKGASARATSGDDSGMAEFEISRPYTDDITTND